MELSFRYQVIALAAVVVALAGCNQQQAAVESRPSSSPSISAAAARDLQIGAQKTASATKIFIAQNKDQFVAATQKQLQTVDSAVNDLTKKCESYRDDAKAQADKLLVTVKERREAAARKLEELRAASKETWANTKSGFASSLEDLHKALDDARSKIN